MPTESQPTFVNKEDFDSFKTNVIASLRQPTQTQSQSTVQVPEPPKEEPIDDISNDDYESALLNLQDQEFEGDRRSLIRSIEKRKKADEERINRRVTTQINQIRQETSEQLGNLTTHAAQAATSSLPNYNLFKDEIDQAVNNLQPTQRSPEMVKFIHDQVSGQNIEKVLSISLPF